MSKNEKTGLYPKPSSPCNCMNIRRASRAVSQFYDSMLEPGGITLNQFGMLNVIDGMQAPGISELAGEFRVDRTTMNRNLKPLLEKGLICQRQGSDARRREIVLTESGRTALLRGKELWDAAQKALEDYLGADELKQLKSTLSKLEALVP
ncbi:MarR family winged helix-turn-helix transcriptional regulator [Anaerovibrio sp.]|uniref:MarR family winged helix-turn-helix transcriptional regulator n=1 Tax=Anaerovibrio sp. TaxID=1872532 RepID=UPI003F16663E